MPAPLPSSAPPQVNHVLNLCDSRRLTLSCLHTLNPGPRAPSLLPSGLSHPQELRLVSAGPDLTAAGLLQLAALPRLKRLSLVACPCATEPAVQQLVAAVRGRRDGGGAAVAAAVGAAAGGGGGSGGGGGGGGEVRQPRRRRRLRLEVLARANSSPTGSVGGAGAGAAQPQAEAPAPQVYNI